MGTRNGNALTFQLAADVVNTSFAPTSDELGHLAAIAAIRTFLGYFLDREMDDTSGRQKRARDPRVKRRGVRSKHSVA